MNCPAVTPASEIVALIFISFAMVGTGVGAAVGGVEVELEEFEVFEVEFVVRR